MATPQIKTLIVDRMVTENDPIAQSQTLEVLENYEKISDIIARTHAAMGRSREIKMTTAYSGSDKVFAYVPPSTH